MQNILSKDWDASKKLQGGEKFIKVEELQRIKTAFAEGYQAGYDQKPIGKAYKAVRFTYHAISVVVLLSLLVILIGK